MSRRMQQLNLFSAEAEAERTLREDYDILAAYYRALDADCEALKARLEKARGEFRTVRDERDQARRERDNARREAGFWREIAERLSAARPTVPAPASPTLEPTLKKLLTIAHPDRWQRGQPAAELAHELTVTINSLRKEGRP
jgi:hypothetical protein